MKIHNKIHFFNTLFRSPTPVYLILYITSRCNLKCKMCFYWQNIDRKKKNELTLEEIEKISKNFSNLIQLSITGGEPFLRSDIAEIINIFITNNKTRYITIPTNASMPEKIYNTMSGILKKYPDTMFRISLSIDGLREKHDYIRGVKGSFDKVIETYKKLCKLRDKYNNFIIDINTTFSSYNENQILEIYNFVKNEFIVDNYSVTFARGNTRSSEARKTSVKNYKEIIELIEKDLSKIEARPFSSLLRAVTQKSWETIVKTLELDKMIIPCSSAGNKLIIIEEEGDVYPCEILHKRMGNLREYNYDIKKIINSKKGKEIIKFIKDTKCYCTFECAINTNIIFYKRIYLGLFFRAFKNFIKTRLKSNNI